MQRTAADDQLTDARCRAGQAVAQNSGGSTMTDTLPHVVVPYADFLERRERRLTIAAERQHQGGQPMIDDQALSGAVERPLPSEQKYRSEAHVVGTT